MSTTLTPQSLSTPKPSPPVRWWTYRITRRFLCAAGHTFPITFEINETGFGRCSHAVDGGQRECGRWIFVYHVRGGGYFIADVTQQEKAEMRKLSTPAEMIEYLGILTDMKKVDRQS